MRVWFGNLVLFVCLTTSAAIAGPKEDISSTTAKWMEAFGENNTAKVVALTILSAVSVF
jgi:hypothetical protein